MSGLHIMYYKRHKVIQIIEINQIIGVYTKRIQKLFHVTQQSHLDMSDILLASLAVIFPQFLNFYAFTHMHVSAFAHLTFSSVVRDLGATLDQKLVPHIHSLCHSCYYQLLQLRTVSRSLGLSTTATATLVQSFVTFRLDYCSSPYAYRDLI